MAHDDRFFDPFAELIIRRRNGPHWRQEGKIYFVTWRQGDSLPREARDRIEAERIAWSARHGNVPFRDLPEGTKAAYRRLFAKSLQKFLDAGYGSCVLRRADAREILTKALHHFNGTRYDLGSFAIAGNHVHVLVAPKYDIDLTEIQHSWKSFTANRINALLGVTGRLWRPESYDRIVRDVRELKRIEHYILKHRDAGHYVERLPLNFF